jgi:hypothetical protein
MSGGRLYLLSAGLIAGLCAWAAVHYPGGEARGIWLALGVSIIVQGPLGWWLLRSIGTERFLLAWVGGILARFALLGLVGLLILPALNWPLTPGILALVVLLLAFLLLEVVVLLVERSRTEAR